MAISRSRRRCTKPPIPTTRRIRRPASFAPWVSSRTSTSFPSVRLYEPRGRLFSPPLTLPHGFAEAEQTLAERFPQHQQALRRFFQRVGSVREALAAVGEEHDSRWWFLQAPTLPLKLWQLLRDMRSSLAEVLDELLGDDGRIKIALCANLPYYADHPDRLSWLYYAIAQGGYLAGGGYSIRGGSGTLSARLVEAVAEHGGIAIANRTVTSILLDDAGRAVGVAHVGPDGSDRQEVRAPDPVQQCSTGGARGNPAHACPCGFPRPLHGAPNFDIPLLDHSGT